MNKLLKKLNIELPIVQAPMAGVSTQTMAAAVSNAGALGSIAIGAVDVAAARAMVQELRSLTIKPFNVNVFCHQPAVHDSKREVAWLETLAPHFTRFGARPPATLQNIYKSFIEDEDKLDMLLAERPAVVSFHFGLPSTEHIHKLKEAGIVLIASATNLHEANSIVDAGIDVVVAQGYEAGGHRGIFDVKSVDDRLGTLPLTRLFVQELDIPVIAAGGIMDGAGILAALDLGASAAQLGTAFIGCPESSADGYFRAALFSKAAHHTVMTNVISGRPARCLSNLFTEIESSDLTPDYPLAYDAGKALNAAAKATNEGGYGAQWAGQGAPLARAIPTAELIAKLMAEMQEAVSQPERYGL